MNPSTEEDNQEEEYEILDVTENAQQRMSAFIEYVGRIPQLISRVPHSDVAVAGLGGWAVGYLFKKVGRVAATSVGGGLCLMQLAYQSGYITINWNKLNRDMNRTQRIVNSTINENQTEIQTTIHKVKRFFKKNVPLSMGFAGGFLIGMAT